MKTRIEHLPEKILVGKSMRMSLTQNTTSDLWKSFMKDRAAINYTSGTALYSIQVYDDSYYFEEFSPETKFTKWAAMEVKDFKNIPNGFSSYSLVAGLYAVFIHIGTSEEFPKTFQYILGQWLPRSQYELDDRPHFEILGERFKKNDPNSQEEVWIPIKKRA